MKWFFFYIFGAFLFTLDYGLEKSIPKIVYQSLLKIPFKIEQRAKKKRRRSSRRMVCMVRIVLVCQPTHIRFNILLMRMSCHL